MAASIGEQLRLAREERGMGLREICEQTRISVHYLEAIEANDYKRLPGGVFNRSFIKAYAKCVGYDEREAIEGYTRYLREHGESSDDIKTTPLHSKVYTDTPATRSPVLTVVLAILILAILTAAALAALHWFQRRASVTPTRDVVIASLRTLRISAPSALKFELKAENAEIRRGTQRALNQSESAMYNELT
ncbi:MAG TPA: helix-turn-helix domain-containing protein [Pyrinomonadaceae bacterium]|jgi:cytoskeletal protein RodZ